MTDPVLLCYCTCPDDASAQALAEALVGEGLAACVNRIPGIRSTYRWKRGSPPASRSSRAMRSAIGGWVENRLRTPPNGLAL